MGKGYSLNRVSGKVSLRRHGSRPGGGGRELRERHSQQRAQGLRPAVSETLRDRHTTGILSGVG